MSTMTKTMASHCWPRTTRIFQVVFLATFAHAVLDDACRGTCDRFPNRFCEGWIGSCDRCLPSTRNTKCIEYFEKLIKTTTSESKTPVQDLTHTTSPTATTQTTTSSLDFLITGEDVNSSPSQNQTDSGEIRLGEEKYSGASVLIGPFTVVLVVITLGVICVCRNQCKSQPAVPAVMCEDPPDVNQEEKRELVKMSMQEEGEVGGPSLLPNGQHVYLKNEVEDKIKETS